MGLFDKLRGKKTEEAPQAPAVEPMTVPAPAQEPTAAPIEPIVETVQVAPEPAAEASIPEAAPVVAEPASTQEIIQDVQPAPAVQEVTNEPLAENGAIIAEPATPIIAAPAVEETAVGAPAVAIQPTEAVTEPVAPTVTATSATNESTPTSSNVLVIGDIFTDAFIQLADESAKVIKEADGREWLALPFGQKPPYDHVDIVRSVGPSPNAAVSMARLGLTPELMAWVGDDAVGKEAIEHLATEHVGTAHMVTEAGNKTSYWYVLRYGADRTMLVKSEKYKYEWQEPAVAPDWIYLAYIGEDSWPLHEKLADYLTRNPNVKFALQPGTFHWEWGIEKMAPLYKAAYITIMNREEAADATGKPLDSIHELAAGLHALGPKIVVITDGPKGSYASYDGKVVTIPNYPDPAKPLDRTGAGDAFASTIVSALAQGKTMDGALTWAPINSMSVVQKLGAQAGLLTPSEVQSFLASAPADYKVTELAQGA